MEMAAADGATVIINNSLAHEIKHHLENLPGNSMEAEMFTIFRVPAHIREKNKELYKPRMVSIGPYYHSHKALQAMEKHKWRYLRDYLSRNSRNNVEQCISELRGLESGARRCYFEEVKLNSDKFLKMMLLDGSFIIEFLIKWYLRLPDAIFNVGWVLPIIKSDLLLLENQIPFLVIQKLYSLLNCFDPAPTAEDNAVVGSRNRVTRIPSLDVMLLKYLSENRVVHQDDIRRVEIKHILHLYHLCYVPLQNANNRSTRTIVMKDLINPIKLIFVFLAFLLKLCLRRKSNSIDERAPRTIPSATDLQKAGITFKSKRSENILDINFKNGTLEIPFIAIEDTRRSRLLNLVSFEQSYRQLDLNLTSYSCFMGALFKTTRDVTLLQEKKIIDNMLATHEELVSFFNRLTECSFMNYEAHYLKEVFIDVNRYYNSDWNKWMATLQRDYFNNPWSIISFAAESGLLVLTALQTFYTVFPYYHTK
ncbi:hypothetical protein LUZ62_091303 [Rhynchospora pubera]|uniref:Uncharacterized protein n=1 Tax=Rhynchospora pubera TaxID=906938 RepID=A0AAV8CM13_9POAL|nr:hypothetical protein LUZ62_091303 [Rhynchospora pubera]